MKSTDLLELLKQIPIKDSTEDYNAEVALWIAAIEETPKNDLPPPILNQ